MKVIIDSREQLTRHITKWLDENGISWERRTLSYCDYSFEQDGVSYENKCAVERKNSLTEIAGNFGHGRNRFETEFCKGKADGCKMVLLIEDKRAKEKIKLRVHMDAADMDDDTKFRKTWRSKFTGNAMVASIKAFKDRYNLDLVFCNKVDVTKEMLKVFNDYLEEEKGEKVDE